MFRIFASGVLAFALLLGGEVSAQSPDRESFARLNFSADEFAALKTAIIKREKWSPSYGIADNLGPSVRRVFGVGNEISDIELLVSSASLKFQRNQPDPTKTINEFSFSFDIRDALDIRTELLNWSNLKRFSSPPIVGFMHSQHGSSMPAGGFVSDPKNKAQLRLLLNSAEDTQLVVFLPVQYNSLVTGFMLCPREVSKLGNASVGRLLTASKFSLSAVSLKAVADVLAKVLEGYGNGVSYSAIRVESFPPNSQPGFSIEDLNAGYFPESVVVLPENQQAPEVPVVPNQLNELGVRIDVALKDSGDNQLLLSLKRSIGIMPTRLENPEPMTAGPARLSVQPGDCHLIIQRTWYDSRKIAGNKEIQLPE